MRSFSNVRQMLLTVGFVLLAWGTQAQNYYVYVAAESEDEVAVVHFDGKTARVAETIAVGYQPTEIEGPHGITVDPSGEFWYLSMAHGNPYGRLYKYRTDNNKLVDYVELGIFPATMQISEASGLLFCVNFNLHGRMVPSTVSVVDPVSMSEITKITTGSMPHGSRISPDGLKHYSVAMMSGELFEIDALSLQVSKVLKLDKEEAGMDHSMHAGMDHSQHMNMDKGMSHSKVKPTWVIPHPTNGRVYVAGNGSDEILEIDTKTWETTRTFTTGKGPYNVEISPDGKTLVATYKSEGTTAVWNLKKGKEATKITNSRKVSHGIAISSDSKYAFISVEGKGGQPGSVDVIDLKKMELVAYAEVGKQAGGIAFWKMED
ncbi:MAG: YncE family protein [Cytophagales bacterium]|nr:YncE family protein [Cytophagales bacterium]